MEGWSLKAAVNDDDDDDDQPSMLTSTEVSSQNLVTIETPGRFDVLLGRGKMNSRYPGNERLQTLLNMQIVRYNAATSRNEKTAITQEIVQSIQTAGDRPGRFLKFDKDANGWVEIDDAVARIKVSHAIRYSSRNKNRKAPPESSEAPSVEPSTLRSDNVSHQGTVCGAHEQERPRDRSPLVFDESILAGLGHDIPLANDFNDDDASVLYD
jgi:hypothetical protein